MAYRLLQSIAVVVLGVGAACGGAGSSTTPTVQTTSGQPNPPATSDGGTPTTQPAPDAGTPATPPPSGPKYVAHVDCSPVNDFGHIGWVKGELAIGARANGALTVIGTLNLRYQLIGGPESVRDVQVTGIVENTGGYVSLRVVSGADDIENMYLVFKPGPAFGSSSEINGTDGQSYQTACTASTAVIPQGSDLQPDGWMGLQLAKAPGGGTIAHVGVVNVGNQPAMGASGRVSIAGFVGTAELVASPGGTATTPNTVNPGERGYLNVVFPGNPLDRCTGAFRVAIDLDKTFQAGDPDPFLNDTADVPTPCLTWSSPITEGTLGVAPSALVDGKSLADIVGSFQIARADGNRCSQCHYAGAHPTPYVPPVQQGGSGSIGPNDVINTRSWANGWGNFFLTTPGDSGTGKPQYLKDVVQQWLADGARP